MSNSDKKIIIDCDTGIDDALALLLALQHSDWNILGITAVSGNVPLEHTAPNCIRICTLAGKKIPVYAGAAKPLYCKYRTAEQVHGKNGLGGVELPLGYDVEEEPALSYLTRTVRENPGDIEIIAVGPLTNIALAVLTDPHFSENVAHLTIMGGAIHGGNATAAAEFNIYADPEAAKIVFNAGIPMTMIGLDVTNRALLGFDVVERWRASDNTVVRTAGELLFSFHHLLDGIEAKGYALHDPLTIAYVMDPTLVTTRDLFIDVETKNSLANGKTVADELQVTGNKPNVSAAVDLQSNKFLKLFVDAIEGYSRGE
ncbi:MAG: nucleoside hydrolase [Bacteroidetes bacterium]|nr:nucleoside hydrolase [Bacteroidota bacterium]